ncbi:hypothetical protein DPMN_184977 [Dreissena polymorpha]|uniref:Uncharacterized protein n=1 Tax=Dreissena polymorpha TaxID=45954 RepID=A0A9D4DMS8_DREPO|nr:hypothetical protein DPMN_184977 [Dreissena polymorpha]
MSFLGDYYGTNNVYEDITNIVQLKKLMQDKLEDYNETPGVVRMDLVLFRDAIEHSRNVWRFYLKPLTLKINKYFGQHFEI